MSTLVNINSGNGFLLYSTKNTTSSNAEKLIILISNTSQTITQQFRTAKTYMKDNIETTGHEEAVRITFKTPNQNERTHTRNHAVSMRVGLTVYVGFKAGLSLLTLTHWGRVTHICVIKLTNIRSDNGLLPGRRQAIIWTNVGILSIGPLGTNFSEILIKNQTISLKKNVVCEIAAILSPPQCVKLLIQMQCLKGVDVGDINHEKGVPDWFRCKVTETVSGKFTKFLTTVQSQIGCRSALNVVADSNIQAQNKGCFLLLWCSK